jgi:hypothetical protein
MTTVTVTSAPTTVADITARIKNLKSRSRQNQADAARLNLQLGVEFNRLKARAPGVWLAKLRQLGFSPRVISRLMKAASVLAAPDGTVPAALLDRLPGDPLKLEALCALPRPEVEELVQQHDVRNLDRAEIAAEVRERQGKTAHGEKKPLSPTDSIRKTWSQAVEGVLKKLEKVEAKEEREQLIQFLDESLEDVKQSLHAPAPDSAEDEAGTEVPEGDELARQEADEGEAAEEEAEPATAREEAQRPAKADKAPAVRVVGRQRPKPQEA